MNCILADIPKCFGSNVFGSLAASDDAPGFFEPLQAIAPPGFDDARAIAVGNVNICAWFADDRVECLGYTEELELGSLSSP